jgi:hypothetical protein
MPAMRRWTPIVVAASVIVLLCGRAEARRWSYFEGDVGGTLQLVDADFRRDFGPSLMAGLKTGAFYAPPDGDRIGWEVAADFTLFDYQILADSNVYRLRLLGGARYERPLAGDLRLVLRAMGGLDFIVSSVPDTFVGTTVKEEDSNLGPVVEPSGGVLWQSGSLLLGLIAALPIAYHHDGDPGDRPADFDYLGVEFDVLFTVGASL